MVSLNVAGDTPYLVNGAPDDVRTYLTGGFSNQQALYFATDYPDPPIVLPSNRSITVTVAFSHRNGVRNVSFQTWDIDRDPGNFTDEIMVTATDGTSTFNPTAVANDAAYNAFDGVNKVAGIAAANDVTSEGTVTWTFNQSNITSITIVYRNVEASATATQHMAIHDIAFEAHADLSASTKTVMDINGGALVPGDTLRYTIAVTNAGDTPANDIAVWDDLPPNLDSYSIVSIPAGATNNSTGPGTGANGTGRVVVDGFALAGGASASIVVDVVTSSTTPDGTAFDNTVGIYAAEDTAVISAPTIYVNAPSAAGRVKELYLDSVAGNILSRTRPTITAAINIAKGNSVLLRLNPRTVLPLTLASGTISIPLRIAKQGVAAGTRDVQVTLDTIGGSAVLLGSQALAGIAFGPIGVYQTVTFNVALAAPVTLNANTAIRLRITNNSTGAGTRSISVQPVEGGQFSRVALNALTVIHVDSVGTYTAAHPGGSIGTAYPTTATIFIRATVSDPFGAYDIAPAGGTAPGITIMDSAGITRVSGASMAEVSATLASKTFEYAYVVPADAAPGDWIYAVTAHEGVEGTVSDSRSGSFRALAAAISIIRSSAVLSDPINGTANPKRIPGATLRFTVTVANGAVANATAASIAITEVLPADLAYTAGTLRRSADATCDDADSPLTDAYDFADDGSISAGTLTFGDSNGGVDLSLPPDSSRSYCFQGTIR